MVSIYHAGVIPSKKNRQLRELKPRALYNICIYIYIYACIYLDIYIQRTCLWQCQIMKIIEACFPCRPCERHRYDNKLNHL